MSNRISNTQIVIWTILDLVVIAGTLWYIVHLPLASFAGVPR